MLIELTKRKEPSRQMLYMTPVIAVLLTMITGGIIFTLADSAFAFSCNSHNQRTVAASADISFLKSAFEGERLEAVAEERWREGRNGIYDVRVTNQNGVTIAEFRGKSRSIKGTILEDEEAQDA